ncbi:hypothetical protein BJV77DRAFT_366527 [Russula vinacea]|nr:hypothetical protein BJV77DRAFT_366527 [Russula vinacea]
MMLAHICAACSSPVSLCAPPIILLPTNLPNSNTLTLSSLSPVKETTSFSSKHEFIRSITPTPNRHIPAPYTLTGRSRSTIMSRSVEATTHRFIVATYMCMALILVVTAVAAAAVRKKKRWSHGVHRGNERRRGCEPRDFRVVQGALTTVVSFPPREAFRLVTDFALYRHM